MRNSDRRVHGNLKYTPVSKANEERTSTCNSRKLDLTTVRLGKMEEKPIRPLWGLPSLEHVRDTKPATLTSSPEKGGEREDTLTVLEQEVDRLKIILTQQSHVIQSLGDQLLTPSRSVTTTKPRDVPLLELNKLQGLNATTQLQIFFELIEQCSNDDARRVQIAKGRVSTELAALIHNHQTLHGCTTWATLKQLFESQFSSEINFDRAWQEIDCACYDWAESPQAFTNDFICKYAILETRFAGEKLPNRDKTIKRKLWQGLTQESKNRLEGFLDEDYPLKRFIDRVEHERLWLEATHTPSIGRVKPEERMTQPKGETNPVIHNHSPNTLSKPNATSSESSEVDELKRQIKDLTEHVGKLQTTSSQSPTERYCSHCRSYTHSLKECWRKPARGSCFDCRRYGCWRGNKNCPGKRTERT